MNKSFISLLLTILFIESCAPAPTPTSEVNSPPTTTTQTIVPTQTLPPTETTAPIPQTQDHLLVTRDGLHMTILNADGSLHKFIQLPYDQYIVEPEGDVSPDGSGWLMSQAGLMSHTIIHSIF